MSVVYNLHAGVCIALLCSTQPANANEKRFVVTKLAECTHPTANDPSLLVRRTVPPGADCRVSGGTTEKMIEDRRLGVVWPSKKGTTVEPRPMATAGDPLSDGTYKACVRSHPPNGEIIDEWIVPANESCEGRGELTVFYRRYKDGKVCLMPTNQCFPVERLDDKGRNRVHEVISTTLSQIR